MESTGQAPSWHPGVSTYRCFLPDLTEFAGPRRTRPNRPNSIAGAVRKSYIVDSPLERGDIRILMKGRRITDTQPQTRDFPAHCFYKTTIAPFLIESTRKKSAAGVAI